MLCAANGKARASWAVSVTHWSQSSNRSAGIGRIGMAALASFPAREVMVGTLGIIFGEGTGDADDEEYQDALRKGLVEARREGQPDRRAFSVPVALSVLVFFALCCQCVSTLVVIKRETASWRWPIFTFVYMTVLAYLGALATFQIGQLF